ncbi:MAG: ABC transporter ATP-binding protein [Hydrogenophilales bacterium]|jgi:lipopolysaccharide transport system ATP-binding protein|nr:ABC transporter ATP-binding protein [Hydrogenophilales bacterium]
MPIIEVDHVSKEYQLGAMQGLKQGLLKTAARLTGKSVAERPLFKALDDVGFSIEQGEVVGIIGHNGAGKSTLLKLLAGISKPTSGSIRVDGRVAPLIEVGAGFIPDFTGRENVYLNGAIMGMSKDYIARKFDEIVDFAEMAEFIDTPVKRYSSGMKVKLAFSVATSISSEILIIDEVLAVGDLAFQQKCIERMENLIKRDGRTVIIVGHNIRQLQRFCERIMLLDHGRISRDGNPSEVCGVFYDEAQRKNIARHVITEGAIEPQRSSGDITVNSIEILDDADIPVDRIGLHEPLKIRATFTCARKLERVEFNVGLHTSDFVHVISVGNALYDALPTLEPGTHQFTCRLSDVPLRPANYALRLLIANQYKQALWSAENIRQVQIAPGRYDITKLPGLGLVDVPAEWNFE